MTKSRKILGASGEDIAEKFLTDRGYYILERNFRLKFGEIDILAKDKNTIVIVEVKTKRFLSQGRPEEQVDYFKQKKLLLLAKAILQMYPNNNIRIDVIAIDMSEEKTKINHIINAVTE